MIALLITVFVTSLVGSLHCAAMCGGIVTLCVAGRPIDSQRSISPHALYHAGRGMMYTMLGLASGAFGAALDLGGSALGWSKAAMIAAGVMMIALGGIALLRSTGMKIGCMPLPAALRNVFSRGIAAGRRLPRGMQPFVIGALTGLLPCGWLYAFVISAAGTGNPLRGALVMATFWAGTIPILLALGIGVQSCSGRLKKHVPRLTALAVVAVGVVTIVSRMQIAPMHDSATLRLAADVPLVQHVESLSTAELPCCHDHPAD